MRESLATLGIITGLGLAVAGCSSASAAPHRASGSGNAPSSTSSSASTTNILLYNINSHGPYYRALLTGAIADFGPAVAVYPDGKVDQGHNSPRSRRATEANNGQARAGTFIRWLPFGRFRDPHPAGT